MKKKRQRIYSESTSDSDNSELSDNEYKIHKSALPTKIKAKTRRGRTQCPVCNKIIKSRHNLPRHLRTHAIAKEFLCELPGCRKTFKSAQHLSDHKKRVHFGVGLRHFCPNCPAGFKVRFRHLSV